MQHGRARPEERKVGRTKLRHDRHKRPPGAVPLDTFLMNPHPKMPDMQLTRTEVADLVAYIRTQKGK